MGLLQEILDTAAQRKQAARQAALQEKRVADIVGDMEAAGVVGVDAILAFRCVMTATAQDRTQIKALLEPYGKAGWRVSPGTGPSLKDMLRNARFKFGSSNEWLPSDDSTRPFVDVLLRVDGILEDASLFAAHGAPTAEKCKEYEGIAVKFFSDHLGKDPAAASAITARRAIARSTVLSANNAKSLEAEFKKLNDQSVFHYIETFLEQVYSWQPTTAEVNAVCYVSKTEMTGWEITGTASSPAGGIDTFSKPAKTTGHLMYAIKKDVANEKKRVIYHFEALLDSAAEPPAGKGWTAITADKVVQTVKGDLKPGQEKQLRDSFPAGVYYKATVD